VNNTVKVPIGVTINDSRFGDILHQVLDCFIASVSRRSRVNPNRIYRRSFLTLPAI